jgi:hypothetical protein
MAKKQLSGNATSLGSRKPGKISKKVNRAKSKRARGYLPMAEE